MDQDDQTAADTAAKIHAAGSADFSSEVHGDTATDSHHDLPRIDVSPEVLRARELAPFRAAVGAGVATIMTSHIVVDALDAQRPATFSPVVLGVLRDELGFTGVIVSDALDMAGASERTALPAADEPAGDMTMAVAFALQYRETGPRQPASRDPS